MTQLLVSVRNGPEAIDALAGGAHVIDVKEPRNGPLGAGSSRQLAEVLDAVKGQALLSAALGELKDGPRQRLQDITGYSFVKVGMAGCARLADWEGIWCDFVRAVPDEIRVVGVIYADFVTAAAPAPRQLIHASVALGISYLLIDTFQKSGSDLLEYLNLEELHEIVDLARDSGMRIALAGSLTRDSVATVLPLRPDYVAMRGAVCRNGRMGPVDRFLVRQMANHLSTTDSPNDPAHHNVFVDSKVHES